MNSFNSSFEDYVTGFFEAARYGDLEELSGIYQDLMSKKLNSTESPSESFHINYSMESSGLTAIHMAAANGHESIVQFLLDHGADVNIRNREGNTPTHWAALNGHEQIIKIFLNYSPDLEVKNEAERTCIMEAMQYGYENIVTLLLNATKSESIEDGLCENSND